LRWRQTAVTLAGTRWYAPNLPIQLPKRRTGFDSPHRSTPLALARPAR
jgi:hypothetical protein